MCRLAAIIVGVTQILITMTNQAQQQEYLASVAQSFDVGDFDYMSPDEMHTLNALIAEAWQAFKQGEDVEPHIGKIEKALGR